MVSIFQKIPKIQIFNSEWQQILTYNSEFDKNLCFFREFAQKIYPRPRSIFEIGPRAAGNFRKFPAAFG